MEIPLSPFFAKLILKFNTFKHILVVCKGYNEDYENFTELVRRDDNDLDFFDKEYYPEIRLWIL